MTSDQQLEQFAARLSELADRAEQIMRPDEILSAMLSAALAFATRKHPTNEVVQLLRDAAARLESDQAPRTVN